MFTEEHHDLKCLGKSDVIVINVGSKDIDKPTVKDNGILISMVHFIQKYNNTNIVIINIPHRHDLTNRAKTNLCIQAYNYKLKNILKAFKHVSLVEMSTNWRHFTKHGLHLNSRGKEWLAKQTALQIELLVEFSSKVNPVIPFKWKKETMNLTNENIVISSEIHTVEGLIPSVQTLKNQTNMENNESICRIFTRNKKVPITMSKDFLW
jgi:hypothetical protein